MWFSAFLEGLTVINKKNQKKLKKNFFGLKYTTLINPYTNHKKHAFLKTSPQKWPKMTNLKIAFF
jgi:hypothetical protein